MGQTALDAALRASSFEPDGENGIGLLTDLYELTMAEGYWRSGLADMEA